MHTTIKEYLAKVLQTGQSLKAFGSLVFHYHLPSLEASICFFQAATKSSVLSALLLALLFLILSEVHQYYSLIITSCCGF